MRNDYLFAQARSTDAPSICLVISTLNSFSAVLEKGSASLDVSVVNPEGEPLDTKVHVDLTYRAPVSETLKGDVGALTVRVKEVEELLRNLKLYRLCGSRRSNHLTWCINCVHV